MEIGCRQLQEDTDHFKGFIVKFTDGNSNPLISFTSLKIRPKRREMICTGSSPCRGVMPKGTCLCDVALPPSSREKFESVMGDVC